MGQNDESLLPDPHGLRRFALVAGLILLVYTLAGGHLNGKVNTVLIDFGSFDRPWVLLVGLALASAYASFRYWYYVIRLPLTRTKIRQYLMSPESILAFVGKKHDYRVSIEAGTHTGYLTLHSFLTSKSPAGFDPFDLVVGAGQSTSPNSEIAWDQVRASIARQFDSYFPGIKFEEVRLWNKDAGLGTAWASVDKVNSSTRWYILLEDTDLHLPLYLNGFGLAVLVVFQFIK